MKRVSLAQLAVNAPEPSVESPSATTAKARKSGKKVIKITREEDNNPDQRIQVAFRMGKDAYKDLKRMALDEDTTVNELMVRAINELRERQGLKKLTE